MIFSRRGKTPRQGSRKAPQHARPSVLAPTRALAVGGTAAIAAVAVVAGCAAVTHSGRGSVRRAAAPNAVHQVAGPVDAAAFARGAVAAAAPAGSLAPPAGTPVGGLVVDLTHQTPDTAPVSGLAESGIPSTALAAYEIAAAREAVRRPSCGLTWPLLGGIGRVESNHGRFAGAVLHADGVSSPRIIGIPLNGQGTALIRDTDGGRIDGDTVYDRAVGPMQFIPSTWAGWGVDANHDGKKDPFNIFDAAAASADYLCAAGRDLRTSAGQVRAILTYNYSYDYVSMVMGLEHVYASQTGVTVPVLPAIPAQKGRPTQKPSLPPVDPGRPKGVDDHPKKPKPTKSPSSSVPSSGSSSTAPAPSTSTTTTPAPAPSTSSTTVTPPTDPPSTDVSPTCTTPDPTATTTADPSATPTDACPVAQAANASVADSLVTSNATDSSPGSHASSS